MAHLCIILQHKIIQRNAGFSPLLPNQELYTQINKLKVNKVKIVYGCLWNAEDELKSLEGKKRLCTEVDISVSIFCILMLCM